MDNNKQSEIKLNQIEKNKTHEEITTAKNKLKISEDRFNSISKEMKEVKTRTNEIEKNLEKALAEKKEEGIVISLLLYSNEIQSNFRYYNTLDEKLSTEKIIQENLNLLIKEKKRICKGCLV